MHFLSFLKSYIFISLRYRRNIYLRSMLLREVTEELFNQHQYDAENFTGNCILTRRKGLFGGYSIHYEKRLRCLNGCNI